MHFSPSMAAQSSPMACMGHCRTHSPQWVQAWVVEGVKLAALATLFVGEVPRGREALPPRLKVLPGLQGKGPILEEVLRIGPARAMEP